MNIKPSARKTHRKTRTGCRTCKSRKIKCDEQRPSCYNCVKHSVQCDFQITQSTGRANNSGRGVSEVTTSPDNGSTESRPTLISNKGTLLAMNDEHPTINLNLLDLELFHNYITSTANTLHGDPTLRTIWKINVPQLGFQYEFVMRGILALSALHLARYRPEKVNFYTSQAMLQHQTGLRQATSILTEINEENCTSLYIFSALTLFFTVATPRKPEDFLLVGEDGIAGWLTMVKGTKFIVVTAGDTLFKSSLGPMFSAGRRRAELREESLTEAAEGDNPLAELQQLVQKTTIDRQDAEIYIDAIGMLRKSFVAFSDAGQGSITSSEPADIFAWVFRVNDHYLELLRQYKQEALCIFAYFCVVLRRLDSYWWMEGWATHLISKIYHLLDEEHRLWIRWPIEEIGWIPNQSG